MRHFIDTLLEPALWFAVDWSLRWAVLLAVVALLLWIFRARRAAIRQMFLLIALIAGLLVPLTPRWGGWERTSRLAEQSPTSTPSSFPRAAWERTSRRSAARPTQQPDATQSVAAVRSDAEQGTERDQRDKKDERESLDHRRIIVFGLASCWCFVVAFQLIRSLCGWLFLRRLRRESVEATGETSDRFAACRAEMRVRGGVRLATHPHIRSPILLGWLRPCILVPPDWPQRDAASQRAGLLHELAHVRRRDHLLAPLLEIVRIAFFFHPLVRWLLARLEHERELLCDEMVVRLGIDRREYAHLLLEFARLSGRLAWPAVSLPMSRRRTVKGRIDHLLEEDMERWIRPLPLRWAVVLGCALLSLSLGLASYRVWAEEKKATETPPKKTEPIPAARQSAAASIKREDLRYGGKDFYQWRKDILTELKGSIRVDGMRAFAAFGANGFGGEATQAILEIMRGYDTTQYPMSDDDTAVMTAAAQAVGKIGAAALPALRQAVEGKNRNARHFAIMALESMRTNALSAVPALIQAMKNEDAETRSRALQAVWLIDSHAKGFVPALIEALKDESAPIRKRAAITLRESGIVEDAKPAIPALLELLHDKDYNTRYEVIRTLNIIGPEKQGVKAVTQLLREKEFNIRSQAYSFLQSLGPDAKEAVPALVAKLRTEEDGVSPIDTLRTIGPAAKDAIPELNKLLRGESGGLRQRAMQALKKISPDD